MRLQRWSVAYSDPAEGVDCFWIMSGSMVVGSVDGPQSDAKQERRAQLIAAAPDLFEALQWMVDHDETNIGQPGNEYFEDGLNKAKAALAKARGETV